MMRLEEESSGLMLLQAQELRLRLAGEYTMRNEGEEEKMSAQTEVEK